MLCDYRSPHSGTVDSDSSGMPHAAESSLHDGAGVLTGAAAAATEPSVPSTPLSPHTQSAIYESPGEDGCPVYRGFQDPQSQSQSFKKLLNLIESGEGK